MPIVVNGVEGSLSRFSDTTRKGLTFTNDRDVVIFAFHFYFL